MKIKENKETIIAVGVALIIGLAGGFGLGRIGMVSADRFQKLLKTQADLKAKYNELADAELSSVTTNDSTSAITENATHTNSGYKAKWADDDTAFEVEGTYSKLEIKDVYLEKSSSFGYVLTINFVYTNNSDEARDFINDRDVNVQVFQKGVELGSPGWTSEDGVFDTNSSYTDIKEGATIATQLAFTIPDPSEPVEVEIGPWGHSDKKITKTINFIKK